MKYAVIQSGGTQYKVSEGDTIEVDKLLGIKDDKINLDNVLLFVSDSDVKIGKPSLDGVRVKATIIEQKKGDKIRVSKFKSKVRYRRTMGFRAKLSLLKIDKIESALEKVSPSKATPKKKITPKKAV